MAVFNWSIPVMKSSGGLSPAQPRAQDQIVNHFSLLLYEFEGSSSFARKS